MLTDLQARVGSIFAGLTFRLVLLGIIVALLVNTYADISFKGPLGIGLHFEGWKPKAQRLKAEIEAVDVAQKAALNAALAAKAKAEADSRELAERKNNDAAQIHNAAMDAANRHIAANRVRCENPGGEARGTAPAAPDRDTGVHPELPRDSLVAVADDDVRACSAWVSYGISAREWALELEQQHRD